MKHITQLNKVCVFGEFYEQETKPQNLKRKTMSLYNTKTDQMPWWHNQPLHLSIEQMENPNQVFTEFFDTYHLPDIRYCLKEWLEEALSRDSGEVDHVIPCQIDQ